LNEISTYRELIQILDSDSLEDWGFLLAVEK